MGEEFLTDAQMAEREKKANQPSLPDTLTDEQMAQMEASQAPQSDEQRASQQVQKVRDYINSDENRRNVDGAFTNAASTMTGGLSKMLPAAASGFVSKAAKFLAPAVESGAVAQAQDPNHSLESFLMGAGPTAVAKTAASAIRPVGDRAMQFAVGRKKHTPGVGNELADQGVWGTKGMMRDQVNRKSEDAWKNMATAAEEIPGRIDNRPIAQEIYNDATARLNGGGIITPSRRDVPLMEKARAFSDDVASRGQETAPQVLARRGAAGSSAFSKKTQDPLQSQMAELSKAEQIKLSTALKDADPTGRMAAADKTYAALAKAKKPLNEEETISGFGSLVSTVGKHLAAPIASTVGQAGTRGARGLEEYLAPLTRQYLVNSSKKDKK